MRGKDIICWAEVTQQEDGTQSPQFQRTVAVGFSRALVMLHGNDLLPSQGRFAVHMVLIKNKS